MMYKMMINNGTDSLRKEKIDDGKKKKRCYSKEG